MACAFSQKIGRQPVHAPVLRDNFSFIVLNSKSPLSLACTSVKMPTKAFFNASLLEAYNILSLMLPMSGHLKGEKLFVKKWIQNHKTNSKALEMYLSHLKKINLIIEKKY